MSKLRERGERKRKAFYGGQELSTMMTVVLLRHSDSSGRERPGSLASKMRFAFDLMEQFSFMPQQSLHCKMDCNTNQSFSILHPKPQHN